MNNCLRVLYLYKISLFYCKERNSGIKIFYLKEKLSLFLQIFNLKDVFTLKFIKFIFYINANSLKHKINKDYENDLVKKCLLLDCNA